MFTLTYEGLTLYDPRLADRDIYNTSLHLAVDEAGSMSFDMPPTHPYKGQLAKLKGRLELLSDGAVLWRGRILEDSSDFDGVVTIQAEGQLACLNDSIVEPYNFPEDYEGEYEDASNLVEFWLSKLLANHNKQVSEEQQIKLGKVTVADVNNYFARSCEDYSTTWDVVTDKLRDSSLGGHFLVRYESDGTYLDYLADYTLDNTQSVEFAQNLLDLTDELDASEVYTAILPVGKDGLTVADLDDGEITSGIIKDGKVIYSTKGVAQYGRITTIQTWDDVTEAKNLQTKAATLLANTGVMMSRSISVQAVDLHCTDEQIESLRVGRYTPVVSAPHGLDVRYVLSELDLDFQDPAATRLTFGATTKSMSDRANNTVTQVQNVVDSVETAKTETAKEIAQLGTTYHSEMEDLENRFSRRIEETESKITSEKTIDSKISSAVEQSASGVLLTVSKSYTTTTEFGTWTESYDNYFDFSDGLTIGRKVNGTTSPFSIQITNEQISFREQNAITAYITGKVLYIPDAKIENSLRLGNFAFVPRDSNNLSLVKLEG